MVGELPLMEVEEDGGGRPWSSLHVLVLWMIKDKLDIFDNWRFSAVCRDWRSASACYPKPLQTVGDGLPWIWDAGSSDPPGSTSQEFISLTRRGCKYTVDMPEFVEASVLSSKQGWILLRRRGAPITYGVDPRRMPDTFLLVNPLTRAKIELPSLVGAPACRLGCHGSFTTTSDGGYPDRVFIHMIKDKQVVIATTCPGGGGGGDRLWTKHVFVDRGRRPSQVASLTAIGHKLYCNVMSSGLIIYDLDNHSWKEVAHPSMTFYIAELDGELLGLPRRDVRFSSYEVYRYKDDVGPSSWEKLEDSEVMGVSWFLYGARGCIAAKGGGGQGGLMVHILSQHRGPHSRVCV